jgi:dipeptidyl aminopeptidase/acylaminoacyl peptidase
MAACLLAVSVRAQTPAGTHPFGWNDLFAMTRLADIQPSPDGRWLLFQRTDYDLEANKGNGDIGLATLDGKTSLHLTLDPASDSNARWLPDGMGFYFLSNRSGRSAVYRMSLLGGESQAVANLPVDVEGFELSPDGRSLLFWADVFPDCKDLDCTAKRLKERSESKVKARIHDRLFVRHWDAWSDGRRSHLFAMSLSDMKPVDLMAGMDQDSPTKPFGGPEEVSWSPDGKTIAFVSIPPQAEAWKTNNEIYLVPSTGGPPALITAGNQARDTRPVFSPDGGRLAYLAMDRPGSESDRLHVVIYDRSSGERKDLTKDWDRSVDEMIWSEDGKSLFVTALEGARTKIFSVDAFNGEARPVHENGINTSIKASGGKLLFLNETMRRPKEVFLLDPKSGGAERITRINDARLAQARLSEPEEFWFENDGRKLHAWFLKPVDFRSGRKHPLAMIVHGGPEGSMEDGFHYRWNPQFYAGAGYAVLMIDFRGSAGYGQAFTDSIVGNWGPGPASDLMAGLNEALRKYPWVDRERLCALGASYGATLINWMAGEKNPFQCLVSHDGDFDLASSYYGTEELWFPEWEMTGPPWEKPEVYARNTPSSRVKNWKTPMLIIHGGKDFRVPETEGLSAFNALQRLGVPSRLLYFPDENHWVLKPRNSRLWHETVLGWIDRWTKTQRD